MRSTLTRVAVTGLLAVAAGLPGRVAAQPSTNLADYALFAETKIKTKGLTLSCGNVGVNQVRGKLIARRHLSTPGQVVTDVIKVGEDFVAGTTFANLLAGKFQPAATPWTPPIIGDLAGACGFPNPFPACDPGNPVLVLAGTTTALPPGVYGDVTVKGGYDEFGEPLPAVLELGGGSYTFCGMKLARFADVRFTAPATVNVATNLRMQANNVWGPADGSGLTADDIVVYVGGSKVHYSRNAAVSARLCAPSAKCRLTNAGSHAGAVYCRFIRTEQITFVCTPGGGSPSGAFVD